MKVLMSHHVPNANISEQFPKHKTIYKCNSWELGWLDFAEYMKVTRKILESSKEHWGVSKAIYS